LLYPGLELLDTAAVGRHGIRTGCDTTSLTFKLGHSPTQSGEAHANGFAGFQIH